MAEKIIFSFRFFGYNREYAKKLSDCSRFSVGRND